jgi:chromosome partitioning protein
MPHITTIANNKGGVGKSHLTVQLAAALARRGLRVLVVDLDPQANTTRRLGIDIDPQNAIVTMSEVIKSGEDGAGESAVLACGWVDGDGKPTPESELIDVLPARYDLINRESEAAVLGAVRRLRRALTGWIDDYDVILIDTRPDLGHLVQMAFAAADTILIPTDPAYDSIEAAIRVRDFVERHAVDLVNPDLRVAGVVVTRRKPTAEHDFQIQGIEEQFGDLVWNLKGPVHWPDGGVTVNPPYIPEWSRFTEADAAAASLNSYNDRNSRKTVALYDALASRFVDELIPTGANA